MTLQPDDTGCVLIGDKKYKTIIVRGTPHIRIAANIPLEDAGKFILKSRFLKRDVSLIVNMLVQEFNFSSGWTDERIKSAGDLFDARPTAQTHAAGYKTSEGMRPLYQ